MNRLRSLVRSSGVALLLIFCEIRASTAQNPPDPTSPGAAPNRGYTFVNGNPPAKTAGAKNLAIVVHGLNSNPTLWANGLRDAITTGLVNLGNAAAWDVATYNWQADAANLVPIIGTENPLPTTNNIRAAQVHGQRLAKHILDQSGVGGGYEHVHFLGHSLGGRVIESAANALAQGQANGNQNLGKKSIIHSTFMDAYTPGNWDAVYGKSATWAEHYFSNEVTVLDTQDPFPHAANADVTALDSDRPFTTPSSDHRWPVRWYQRTVENATLVAPPTPAQQNQIAQDRGFGFPLSKEAGNAAWGGNNTPSPTGDLAILPADSGADEVRSNVPPVRLRTAPLTLMEINRSAAGTVALPGADDLSLEAAAANTAWINLKVSVAPNFAGKIDFLRYDFDFTSAAGADGILSFHLDLAATDNATARSLKRFSDIVERFAVDPLNNATTQRSGEIFFPAPLTAGDHVLAVRLDAAAIASKIAITDFRLGSTMMAIPEPATLVLLAIVIAAAITFQRRCGNLTPAAASMNPKGFWIGARSASKRAQ